MSNLDPINACKKRRRGERVFKFKMFGEKGHPVDWDGGSTFVENVKDLLEFGNIESGLCSWGGGGTVSWSFQLEVHRHPPAHVTLFVVEEPVEVLLCRRCKHCQYVGWGHHMICNKKYHFLLPSKYTAPTKGKSNLLELKAHMMHGVFHSNGFGHLLCLNGLEMGSDLPGYRIFEFWDRLCTGLRARKVSLSDDSQKKGMELRLIHGVGYGEPWFGQWGYGFGRGTYGVTLQMYQKAIEALQTMPLGLLAHHLGNSNHEFTSIISRYQTLSSHSLATLGDLFHFMLELKSRLPPKERYDSYHNNNGGILVGNTCRWSQKRVEMATRVIVEALKRRSEFSWVSRQEVRDAARAYIGDTGLLDFVLKSLGNHIVGDYLVRRSLNPVTKVLEYCLEDISNISSTKIFLHQDDQLIKTKARYMMISRAQLTKDMFYLYKFILLITSSDQQNPTRIILDTKYLIKDYYDYGGIASDQRTVMINSTVALMIRSSTTNDNNINNTNICSSTADGNNILKKKGMVVVRPYESFRMNINATIDELKLHVEKRFREVYWGLRSFVAHSILNVNNNAKGSDSILGLVIEDRGKVVVFEGRINEQEAAGGGTANQDHILEEEAGNASSIINEETKVVVVDCACGAQEDDGERMVTCDICEVWQHTRCVRIPNDQEIPTIFLCSRCEHDILLLPNSLP